MRKFGSVLFVLLLVSTLVGVTSAQERVPTVSGAPTAPVAVPAAPNPQAVLWDQPLSSVNQNTYANQDFEVDFDAYDIFVADDVVNTDPWSVDTIFVPGNSWNPGGDLSCANTLNWQIYADDGGVPAGDPWSGGAVWSASLTPSDPQVTLSTGSGGWLTDATLTLDTPMNLAPGIWWFVFYPQLDFSSCFQYGRQPADTANGLDAMVINPGGGFGFPTTWAPAPAQYGFEQHEFAFRLEGTIGPGENTMHVNRIAGKWFDNPYWGSQLRVLVQVVDQSGTPLPAVAVDATFRLPDNTVIPFTKWTHTNGTARFVYPADQTGFYKFCVTNLTRDGYTYVPDDNMVTCRRFNQ